MKKRCFFWIMVISFSTPLFSQLAPGTATKYMGESGAMRFFEMRDDQGALIKTDAEKGVTGSPMLLPNWSLGTIKFKNGLSLTDSAINFSLYNHKLYLVRGQRIVEIFQPITTLVLADQNANGDSIARIFKTVYPAVDNQDSSSLYEVIYEGSQLQLLNWAFKKVHEVANYGSTKEKEYQLVEWLYAYLPEEHKMVYINTAAIQSIKKALPAAYKQSVESYFSSHHSPGKNREQLVQLFAYLDKK